MIPASHVLSGYLAGRFVRWRFDAQLRSPPQTRDPLILIAVAGSVLPDLDVLPGLAFGYELSRLHRGFTHSLVGVAVQALLLATVVWYFLRWRGSGRPDAAPSWRILLATAIFGVASHVFWDALNPWGVRIYSPFTELGLSAMLFHEGDVFVLAILAVASTLVWSSRLRAGYVFVCLALMSYAAWQFAWRGSVTRLAERELVGQRFRVYPNPRPSCMWLVLSAGQETLAAHCGSRPGENRLDKTKTVQLSTDPSIHASMQSSEVQTFVSKRDFPFAEVHRQASGETVVLWRDFRDAVTEGDESAGSGLYVRLAPSGEVLSVDFRWLLRFWFW